MTNDLIARAKAALDGVNNSITAVYALEMVPSLITALEATQAALDAAEADKARAVAEEREACAKLAKDLGNNYLRHGAVPFYFGKVASAIRARGIE